jgi:hypothetical protein
MFNIAIGFTEPEPDRGFIQLVLQIIQAGRQTVGELSCTKKDVEISFLTENNIKDFVRDLKSRSSVKEPVLTVGNCNSFGSDCSKQVAERIHLYEKARFNGFIVLDVSKINKNMGLVKSLSKLLESSGYAILLLNPRCEEFNHLILKYDGTGTSIFSIQAFSRLFPSEAKNAESVTLISPLAFKKSQVAIEKQFVKRTSIYYGALGFIKLPLNTVTDFFGYSLKNKADLLILSKPDLMELLDVVVKKGYNNLFKRNNISVFVGFG